MKTKTKNERLVFFFFMNDKQTIQFIGFFSFIPLKQKKNDYLNHHFFHFTPLSLLHFVVFHFSFLFVLPPKTLSLPSQIPQEQQPSSFLQVYQWEWNFAMQIIPNTRTY